MEACDGRGCSHARVCAGMIFVPHGYTAPAIQFDMSVPHGVSPWGVSTLAG